MNNCMLMCAGVGLLGCVASGVVGDMTGMCYSNGRHGQFVDGFGAPIFDGGIIDFWLEFDDQNDVLLNVYDFSDVNLGMTYYQSFTGATWLPNNLGPPFETEALKYADSFVTIGGDGGAQTNANGTGLDPNFGGTGAAGPGAGAGWYNSDPGTPIGAVVATEHTSTGLGVFIGRFSMNRAFGMSGWASATWNQGLGTEGSQADFGFSGYAQPTPGPLAVVVLGGLARSRRRK